MMEINTRDRRRGLEKKGKPQGKIKGLTAMLEKRRLLSAKTKEC